MASNKTKLADANQKSAFDFDDDFDSYFDDDLGGDKKKPLQEFMSGFKDGLLDPNKNKQLLRTFLTHGAPRGYDRLFGAYDELKRGANDLKDHLEKTNPGDLQYLFKRAEQFLPSVKDHVSESTYDKINNALSNKVEQYNYQIEANQDQAKVAIRRQKKEDEANLQTMLGEDLRSAVDQGTMVQKTLFNKEQAADNRRWSLDRIERGMRDQVADKHNQAMERGMAQAVDAVTRMAAYTEQVNYDFQRKGLELNFRSYLALRDITKIAESTAQMQSKAFQALVRNTGLPDHLKSSLKDLMSMNMRQGMASGAVGMVGKSLTGFLGNYGNTVQGRVNNKASSTLSGIVQGLQTGESLSDFWDMRYNLAGSLAADAVHGGMRNFVAPMAGRAVRPLMTRLSNKYGKGKHNQVGYMMDNIPAYMQDYVNNYQNSYGAKGVLQDMLRPFTPQFGLDSSTKSGSYQTIGQHTAFNQLSQRSLTEIIPGFQARILRELRMMRTGQDAPMEVFDITKGVFTTQSQAQTALLDRIISKGTVRMVSGQMSDTLDKFDSEGKLSVGARKALSERIMRDNATNRRFDPMKYGSKYGWAANTSKETVAELEEFFKAGFERDENGKFADTAANHEKRKRFSDAFLDVRAVSRDPAAEIHRLIETGNTGGLRELGILETVDGQDKINYPMIWKIMTSETSMHHMGDGYRHVDSSGDINAHNFVGPQFPGMFNAKAQSAVIRALESDRAKAIRDKVGDAVEAGADKLKGLQPGAKDLMDQFRADPMQFMRDQFEAGQVAAKRGAQTAQDKAAQLKDSAAAAVDVAKAGGLPAVLEHLSAKEKLDMAKALLENTLEKEPPEMREARLKMAQVLISSIDTAKEKTREAMASEQGQALLSQGNQVLALGHDKVDEIRASEAAGLVDLKLQEGKEVVIKAVDMAQGKLVDVNTGKVITRLEDITGEVRNRAGQVVASATEVAQGLYNNRGELKVQAKEKLDSIARVIKQHAQSAAATIREKADDLKDWCLEGSNEVIIKSKDLVDGKLFDAETGEPIYSLDDIRGSILDAQGRIVATAEELGRGLQSFDGSKYDMGDVKRKAAALSHRLMRGNTTSNVWAAMKAIARGTWNMGKSLIGRIGGDRDAYLPPDVKPILTVEKLVAGGYVDDKGTVLKSFDSIHGPVFDAETGEPLVDKKELKLLIGSDGKKHKIAKQQGWFRRAVKATAKGYWNMTKAYYRQLGGELGNDVKAGLKTMIAPQGSFSKRQLAGMSTTDQILVQVRDAIRETVPKKQRKGSWMEKAEQKEQDAKNAKDKDPNAEKEQKSLFGKLTGAIGGLFDKMRGKKKGDEEEEGSLLEDAQDALSSAADAKDLLGGGGEDGKRRKRRGKLGRLMDRAGKTRVGGWIARQGAKVAASRVGMMAASGIATLFSAPVLIGAAVVGGVGAAGYFGYKWWNSVNDDFVDLRMLQYGVTGTRARRKILALEEALEKSSKRGKEPQLTMNATVGKQIMEIMGFSADTEAELHRFAAWVDKRMKPVFVTWLKALDTVGQTNLKLSDIDSKLDDKLKGSFLQELEGLNSDDGPLAERSNPFGEKEPLEDTREDAKAAYAKLKEKYKVDAKKDEPKLPGVKTEEPKPNASQTTTGGTVVGAAAAAAATEAAKNAKAIGKAEIENQQKQAQQLTSKVQQIAKAAAYGQVASFAAFVAQPVRLPATMLPGLDSIRMRAYGLETLDQAFAEGLLTLERAVYKSSKTDSNGMVRFNGNMEDLITSAGALFGMNTAEHGKERIEFVNWFNERFRPVCEAYLTALRVNYRGSPDQAATQMSLADQVRVANAVMGATSPNGSSVWSTQSIFLIMGELMDLKRLADVDLEMMKKNAAVLSSPTQSAGAQEAGKNAAAGGKSFLDGITDGMSTAAKAATGFVSSAVESVGKATDNAVSTVKGWFGGGDKQQASYSGPTTGASSASPEGQSFGYVQPGNGGKWEDIPMPTAKTAAGSRKTMEAVAAMTGVPVEYLMIFCAMESGFDWTIKAGAGGSATGWFQFINSTWDWVLQQHSSKYGIPPDSGRRLRLDPRINALMGAEYMKYSMMLIKKGTGKDPTDIDLYLAHFLGPGTAVKWIKMPKNTIGASAFQKEARANPSIFYGKDGKARTLAEIEQSFDKRMERFRQMAGGSKPVGVLKPEEAEAKQAEEKQKASEAEAKAEDKGQPAPEANAAAVAAGPSTTGSTPTNAGTGGAQLATGEKPATSSPASGGTVEAPVTPQSSGTPETEQQQQSAPVKGPYQQAKEAAAAARDKDRAKQVQQETQASTSLVKIHEQQLETQNQMLEVLKRIEQSGGLSKGNSMPTQSPSRSANSAGFPVKV